MKSTRRILSSGRIVRTQENAREFFVIGSPKSGPDSPVHGPFALNDARYSPPLDNDEPISRKWLKDAGFYEDHSWSMAKRIETPDHLVLRVCFAGESTMRLEDLLIAASVTIGDVRGVLNLFAKYETKRS